MAIINLRDYYPFYTSDCFMEVSEEVAEMFKEFDRKEAASDGLFLFLHLHLVNVADLALDGLDGLGLIDGLNVHSNGHFSVHLQQLRKELVG